VCILPLGHPLGRKMAIEAADLEGEAFISVGRDNPFRFLIDRAFVDSGVKRRVVVESSHLSTTYGLVAEGVGVSVVDPYTVFSNSRQSSVIVRPFVPEIRFVVNLLKPTNNPAPRIVEEFLKHLELEHAKMAKSVKTLMSRGL
jgi:DNA-binding transcriptional LysR family regulator